MSTTDYHRPRYVSGTEQAKLIRATLKASFPSTEFNVRQSRGSAVRVYWEDGPTQSAVDAIVQLYAGGGFDGMQDLRYDVQTVLSTAKGAELVQFSNDFIFTERRYSEQANDEAITLFERKWGIPFDAMGRLPHCYHTDELHRIRNTLSF